MLLNKNKEIGLISGMKAIKLEWENILPRIIVIYDILAYACTHLLVLSLLSLLPLLASNNKNLNGFFMMQNIYIISHISMHTGGKMIAMQVQSYR